MQGQVKPLKSIIHFSCFYLMINRTSRDFEIFCTPEPMASKTLSEIRRQF